MGQVCRIFFERAVAGCAGGMGFVQYVGEFEQVGVVEGSEGGGEKVF